LANGPSIDESVLFALPGRPKPTTQIQSTLAATGGLQTLTALERDAIAAARERNEGNRRKAAEELGIGLRTRYDKLKRYDLS
jgi:two-component system response regulator FlrC